MSFITYWTSPYKRCINPDHKPFWYWRRDVQERVCDLCNWDTAYMGGIGQLWCYPMEVQQALQKALMERHVHAK